jgi:hypothetical protein
VRKIEIYQRQFTLVVSPEIILLNRDKFTAITKGEKSHAQFARREKKFRDFVTDVEDEQNGHINYFMEVTEKTYNNKGPENLLMDMVKQHIEDFHTFLFKEIDEHSYEEFVDGVINTMDVYGLGIRFHICIT